MAQLITALPSLSTSSTLQNSAEDETPMPRQKVPDVTEWHKRDTTLDTDVMVICPGHPEFMITGTYNLVLKSNMDQFPRGQFRHGTLFVHSVWPFWQPAYPGNQPPILASKKLAGAIVDIHFHPADKTLLAVAVSDMTIHFFRFAKRGDFLTRRIITELIPLGSFVVAERTVPEGYAVFATQFSWLDLLNKTGDPLQYTNYLTVQLVATLSSGEVITVKAKLPGVMTTFDPRLSRLPETISFSRETVHNHDLEAWTVTTIPLKTTRDRQKLLVLSGADDSKLMTSIIELNTNSHATEHIISEPVPFWTDSKSHGSGVVAILALPPVLPVTTEPEPMPILTGSYDERLRLFTLNPHTFRRQPVAALDEIRLGLGGVWHIKLMDHYVVPLRRVTPPRSSTPPTDPRQLPAPPPLPAHETHYVLIVANMHNGAVIVRVTHVPNPIRSTGTWTLQQVARLQFEAHTSLVYDVEARKEWQEAERLAVQDGLRRGTDAEAEEKIEFPGISTADYWSEEWKVELEELMARRRVKPLVIKTNVKWKQALLGDLEDPVELQEGRKEGGGDDDGGGVEKTKRKVKGRGNGKKKRKAKSKRKEKQVADEKDETDDEQAGDDKVDEEEQAGGNDLAVALESLSFATEYEKEQYERGVGKYTCLSVGFYDSKLNTWEWVDNKRREGVGMREFLETA